MMARIWMVIAGLALLAGAASATALLTHHTPAAARAAPPRLQGTDVWPEGARPAPAFALRDQNGRLISRQGLRGQIWAITFLDSHCTQACPIAARELATVQRRLGRNSPLHVVIVSVLPGYDTPARVRAFARKSGLTGDWHWLLGTRQQLKPVWDAYGIFVVTGVQHTAALYLVDQRGNVRVADGVPFLTGQLVSSVRALEHQGSTRRSA